MNKYDELLEWISTGTSELLVAMLAIMYFMIGADGMSESNLSDIMTRIGMSFNTSTCVLTSGETDYTIYDLLHTIITDIYPGSIVITPEFLAFSLYKAKRMNCITSEQYTTLRTELSNA